jgi:hypothetical protein
MQFTVALSFQVTLKVRLQNLGKKIKFQYILTTAVVMIH